MKISLTHLARALAVAALVWFQLTAAAQSAARRGGPPLPPQFGDPLPGLTISELNVFIDGRNDFVQVETPATGLGPIFNNV